VDVGFVVDRGVIAPKNHQEARINHDNRRRSGAGEAGGVQEAAVEAEPGWRFISQKPFLAGSRADRASSVMDFPGKG
jgi:hypothetical protein